MHDNSLTRRRFLQGSSMGIGILTGAALQAKPAAKSSALAVTGGSPVRTKPFPDWPQLHGEEEKRLIEVLKSGKWFSGWGDKVRSFEEQYAALMGSRFAVCTASGTTALLTALEALDIQPGDEVLVSSYTWVASATVIFEKKALATFVDSDPRTFQMDPDRIEEKITSRTRAIIPVHHCGYPCDMDRIMAIAKKHGIAVIEDAAQAHLARYRGKNIGTIGDVGCFSFQASKCLPAGEGGACVGDNEAVMDHCYKYRHVGVHPTKGKSGPAVMNTNYRMTEFQAALLMEQMKGLEERAARRHANVTYLCEQLQDIEGFIPARLSDGAERGAYYNFQLRIDPEKFRGVTRDKFMKALNAEGVPCWGGWKKSLSQEGFVEAAIQSRGFKRLFSEDYLNRYRKNLDCPVTDDICANTLQIKQAVFLGSRKDMDQVADAVRKIYQGADTIG